MSNSIVSAVSRGSARKRIIVVGGTSSIAEYCVRLWIRESAADIVLIGRDMLRLQRVSADLMIRSPNSNIKCLVAEFNDPHNIQVVVDVSLADGSPDIVLIAHGVLPEQKACQADLNLCANAIQINATSPILFSEAFVSKIENTSGTLAIIGSVAGDRGRQSNYLYGAAKGMLERYTEGLRHRLAQSGSSLKVSLIKPGPTETPMTSHMVAKGQSLAEVGSVAQVIVEGIARGNVVIYAPKKWRVIMMIIKIIPFPIFSRMKI